MFDLNEKEQFIKVEEKTGHVFEGMSRLFNLASKKPLPSGGRAMSAKGTEKLLQTIYDPFTQKENISLSPIPGNAKVVVGASGGKDGLAVLIKLVCHKPQHVELFHVLGINRAYPDEHLSVMAIANEFNVPVVYRHVKVAGQSDYIENPTKNQLILALMVEYGMSKGFHTYTQGNLLCDTTKEQDISSGYSDSWEMYDAATQYFRLHQPDYQYLHLLKNDSDSLKTIIDYDPGLLKLVRSCMTPLRYRESLRKKNISKYGVDLMPNRCGSCYKCGSEFLHLVAFGFRPAKDIRPFAEHSIEMIVKGLEKTFGRSVTKREAVGNFLNEYAYKIEEYL